LTWDISKKNFAVLWQLLGENSISDAEEEGDETEKNHQRELLLQRLSELGNGHTHDH